MRQKDPYHDRKVSDMQKRIRLHSGKVSMRLRSKILCRRRRQHVNGKTDNGNGERLPNNFEKGSVHRNGEEIRIPLPVLRQRISGDGRRNRTSDELRKLRKTNHHPARRWQCRCAGAGAKIRITMSLLRRSISGDGGRNRTNYELRKLRKTDHHPAR